MTPNESIVTEVRNTRTSALDATNYSRKSFNDMLSAPVDEEQYQKLEKIQRSTREFFFNLIASKLQSRFPNDYQDYLASPPPPSRLLAYKITDKTDQYQGSLGEYYPSHHITTINVDHSYLSTMYGLVHETIHSVANNQSVVEIYQNSRGEIIHWREKGFNAGLHVSTRGIESGQMLNEGLVEYLTLKFILESQSKEAQDIRHHIMVYVYDLRAGEPLRGTELDEINQFIRSKKMPKNYGEALNLVGDLIFTDSNMEDLLLCSLVSRRAKFLLIQQLRKKYGYQTTREIFRTEFTKRESGTLIFLLRVRMREFAGLKNVEPLPLVNQKLEPVYSQPLRSPLLSKVKRLFQSKDRNP